MKVTCPGCSASYNVPENRFTKTVTQMGCRKCGANLVFLKPVQGEVQPGPQYPATGTGPTGADMGAAPEKKGWSFLKIVKYAAIGFVLLLVAGALFVYGLFYMTKRSDAYRAARAWVSRNPEVRRQVGGRIDDGPSMTSFNVKSSGDSGSADMTFSVGGPGGSTEVRVLLLKQEGAWKVTRAAYLDGSGRPVMIPPEDAARAETKPREAPVEKAQPKGPDINKSTALKYLKSGHRLYREKSYRAAIEEYSRAATFDPENPDAYYWRGVAFIKTGQTPRGLEDLNRTVALDPKYARAYEYMGWVYGSKERYDESIAQFNRLIELRPGYGKAYYQRGAAYFKKGDTKSALSDMEKSCSLGFKTGCEALKQFKKAI